MEVVFDDDTETKSTHSQSLSKKQRNEHRKESNKKWKSTDRKVGSGVDPNPRHTLYYKIQLPQLNDEQEWERFQQALVNPLGVTFRVGSCCPVLVMQSVIHRMNREFKTLTGHFFELNGIVIRDDVVKQVQWMLPQLHVWQVVTDSITLAREPALSRLSDYLRREVALGHIVRQEMASMLPALLLNVQAHHTVLDVCAAPGSKTEQLLYLMDQHFQSIGGNKNGNEIMSGLVVANDADPLRIETLRKRYNRCGSPNLLITCSRAENLSKHILRAAKKHLKSGSISGVFDRIVADVPCSGDGTIRKFPHVWRLFRPRMALELHSIQLQIAVASVMMLKPGGRMVYSTCSINPLEDEAVVCGLLRHFQGKLKLISPTDTSALLPGLVSRPGLTTWQVTKDIFCVGEPDESARRETLSKLVPLVPSMYPPSRELDGTLFDEFHLEYCHRILPQDQDMGGFFVAVLELCHESSLTTAQAFHVVSEQESMATMKRLGYNPASLTHAPSKSVSKRTERISKTSKSMSDVSGSIDEGCEVNEKPVEYQSFEDAQRLCLAVGNDTIHLMQSNARKYTLPNKTPLNSGAETNENGGQGSPRITSSATGRKSGDRSNTIFGSKSDGWIKKGSSSENDAPEEQTTVASDDECDGTVGYISMLSASAADALRLWANLPGLVRQAGVEIGKYYPPSASQAVDGSSIRRKDIIPGIQALHLYGDNSRQAIKCYDRSLVQNIVCCDVKYFLSLCYKAVEVTGPEYIVRGLDDEAEAGLLLACKPAGVTRKRLKRLGNIFIVTEVIRPSHVSNRRFDSKGMVVRASHQAQDSSVLGKRRLSKAEKKKLKKSGEGVQTSPDTVDEMPDESAVPENERDDSKPQNVAEGMVLLLGYNDEYDCFHFVTEADMCASYAAALE
jgi:16S rRNA C967 or C1407 C5-methylase (RsmB/RsmF family)